LIRRKCGNFDVSNIKEDYRPTPFKDILFYILGAAIVCSVGFYIVSLTALSRDTSNLTPPIVMSRLR
jgi:hypothetical protein